MGYWKYVAGYTYNAENYCVDCILKVPLGFEEIGHVFSVEGVLDVVAGFIGINRADETTFDSSEFPKVIFDWQVEPDEKCGKCGEKLR